MNPPDCIFLSIAETNDFSFYGTHIVRTVVCFVSFSAKTTPGYAGECKEII